MTGSQKFEPKHADDAGGPASLIPQLAVEMTIAATKHQVIDGSMLSADISGFTALSEKLADRGKAGAEMITSLLNICFTELIGQAYDFGGEVIKFGGDALLILFRGPEHITRAAAAGLAMQQALRDSSAAKRAGLTMTVGASEGPFDAFMAGDEHRELILAGPKASHVIHLEGNAAKGDTLVSQGIAAAIADKHLVEEQHGGWVITGVIDQERPGPAPRSIDSSILRTLLPKAVESNFDGFAGLGGEHRLVTVGFLAVSGLDGHLETEDRSATVEALDELVNAVHRACQDAGATPLHTDIAPDGLKFVLCAGAPFTEGNTSDSMLEASLNITKISSPFALRVGVQRGRVFAGFLGSPYRHTYTIMGDPVNTAARMLGKAADREVVAVDDVLAATRTLYASDSIEPFLVKGKTNAIKASRVFGATDWLQVEAPAASLIGRDAELKALISGAMTEGATVQLLGPPGGGKTRILNEFRREMTKRAINRVEGHCSPYSASTPYALLQVVIRRTAQIEVNADPVTAGELLYKSVRHHAPELLPMLPILAIPAGAEVAATPESEAIDAKFVRDRIHEVVRQFLVAVLEPSTIFVIEDMQWVDDASTEFFEAALLNRDDSAWSYVISARPGGNWAIDDQDGDWVTVTLGPIPDDQIRQLILEASLVDLPDSALDRIVPQAAGNPLFALELTKAVSDNVDGAVPDTVEQLVATRIDALDPALRRTLRLAAVFGTDLDRNDLQAVLEESVPDLEPLSEFLSSEQKGRLSFVNALYHEVAYEGLPFARRKQLHLRVGEHLERETTDSSSIAGLLSAHFSEAGELERTWRYGIVAGDEAAAQGANVEAAAGYRRALGASSRVRSLDRREVAQVALTLGDIEDILGELDKAERSYRKARNSTEDMDIRATAMLRIGGLREKQGQFGQARSWFSRAEQLLPEAEQAGNKQASIEEAGVEYLKVRSQVHFLKSGLYHRDGDQQTCIREARRSLGFAEDADDVRTMAEALQRLHLATVYLGRPDRIGYGPKALELFTDLGLHERRSIVLNNMGIEKYFAGDWVSAATLYAEASEAGVRAGSSIGGMLGALNSGEILSDQGHWDEAIVQLEAARRNWEGGRYPVGATVAKLFLGVANDRRGSYDEATRLLESAVADASRLGLEEQEHDAVTRLLFHQVALGQASVPEVKATVDRLGVDHPLASRMTRTMAMAMALKGDWALARDSVLQLLDEGTGFDRALTLQMLLNYEAPGSGETREAWRQEFEEICAPMGVVRLRPLPEPQP
ncbi:MAG: adenylate/guanylate cyclase domain-containing protein [Acidimicrobiales bacterium]